VCLCVCVFYQKKYYYYYHIHVHIHTRIFIYIYTSTHLHIYICTYLLQKYHYTNIITKQCLESSKRIIFFKDIKIRDLREGSSPGGVGGEGGGTRQEQELAFYAPAPSTEPLALATPHELVRARITIRALEEECQLLRAAQGADFLAEKESLGNIYIYIYIYI